MIKVNMLEMKCLRCFAGVDRVRYVEVITRAGIELASIMDRIVFR